MNITGREERTHLARKKDRWRAVVITELNVQSRQKQGIFLLAKETSASK
jgi:hypothetical protein